MRLCCSWIMTFVQMRIVWFFCIDLQALPRSRTMCPFSFWSALSSMYILRPSLSRLSRGGFGFNFDCLFSLDCFSLRSWLLSYKGKRKRKRKRKEKKDKQWAREKGQGRGKGKGKDRQDRQKETETEEKPTKAKSQRKTKSNRSHQQKPPKANASHQKPTEATKSSQKGSEL